MRGRKSGAQAMACADNEPSQWQKTETTRRQRLASQRLADAVMSLFADRPKDARWYCLAVESAKELVLEESLKRANVELYVPRERFQAVKKGVKIEGERSVLSGYMLVRILPSARAFAGLKKQSGVIDFVGNEAGYHVVHDGDVAKLKALYETNDISRMPVDRSIGQGTKADITHGPFAGKRCVVVQVTASREPKAKVWIDGFGDRVGVVTLALAFLKKV